MKLKPNTFKNEPQVQNEHDGAVFLKETVEDSIFVEAAKTYVQAGLSPIPAKKDKKPACNWKCYQSEKMSLDDVDASFRDAEAIAVICGKVSGGLEVIDVDRKADPSGRIVKEIPRRVEKDAPGSSLVRKLQTAELTLFIGLRVVKSRKARSWRGFCQ